jgi:hypothetical protein
MIWKLKFYATFQVEEVSKHGWTHQNEKKSDDNEETDEESFDM